MSASVASNPPIQTESKTAKKKRAKAEAATGSHDSTASNPDVRTPTEGTVNGSDSISESPYLKELQRNIRNTNKKLNASQKVASIMAENPGQSLDELVAAKKINADQKASAEKRPALIATVNQLEEQVMMYKKFGQEYEQRFAAEKTSLENAHKTELERAKEDLLSEHASTSTQKARDDLLILSKFLRAAAAKRVNGDEGSNENRAFEGALLQVYGGEDTAVAAMQKLILGSDEQVPGVDSEAVEYTYAQIKQSSLAFPSTEDSWTEDAAQSEAPTMTGPPGDLPTPPVEHTNLVSDPTLVNAGMTELDDGPADANNNGLSHDAIASPSFGVPPQSTIDATASNDIATTSWDREGDTMQASTTLSTSGDGWVDVQAPRDPADTETGVTATPAAAHGSNSWAEEVAVEHAANPSTSGIEESVTGVDDGFHEVVRDHGRGAGRGGRGFRGERGERRGGRGGEGGYRGRGGFNRDRSDRGERGERGDRGEGGYRGRGRGGGGYRGRGRGGGQEGAGGNQSQS